MVPVSQLDLRLRVCRDRRRPKDWDGLPIRSAGLRWRRGDVRKQLEKEKKMEEGGGRGEGVGMVMVVEPRRH